MPKTVIDEAKNLVSKLSSLKSRYLRELKEEVKDPTKVKTFPFLEYKKFWEKHLGKFREANKEYYNSNSLQEKVEKLKIMVEKCSEVFAKKAKWEKYSTYKTEFVSMVQLIDNITKELAEILEEEAKKVKNGNIGILN
ncbi:MAG: hypothetical protein IJG00_00090 [Clostridia bacterium]|nr:hypothetical protein [Clostridia bacterium]